MLSKLALLTLPVTAFGLRMEAGESAAGYKRKLRSASKMLTPDASSSSADAVIGAKRARTAKSPMSAQAAQLMSPSSTALAGSEGKKRSTLALEEILSVIPTDDELMATSALYRYAVEGKQKSFGAPFADIQASLKETGKATMDKLCEEAESLVVALEDWVRRAITLNEDATTFYVTSADRDATEIYEVLIYGLEYLNERYGAPWGIIDHLSGVANNDVVEQLQEDLSDKITALQLWKKPRKKNLML